MAKLTEEVVATRLAVAKATMNFAPTTCISDLAKLSGASYRQLYQWEAEGLIKLYRKPVGGRKHQWMQGGSRMDLRK